MEYHQLVTIERNNEVTSPEYDFSPKKVFGSSALFQIYFCFQFPSPKTQFHSHSVVPGGLAVKSNIILEMP